MIKYYYYLKLIPISIYGFLLWLCHINANEKSTLWIYLWALLFTLGIFLDIKIEKSQKSKMNKIH